MNCKPGDLAIVINSCAGNEGRIVRCIRLTEYSGQTLPDGGRENCAVWEIDKPLPDFLGLYGLYIGDYQLRPLRGLPGNEHFVTQSRKSLPRPTPVTGPVTINHRWEPA